MAYKWIEVTVKMIGEDYRISEEVYKQRINFDYFQQAKPTMVAEIVAVVNDLAMPRIELAPMSPEEIELAFDKEYALHKPQS